MSTDRSYSLSPGGGGLDTTAVQALIDASPGLDLVAEINVTGSAVDEIDTGAFSPAGNIGDTYILSAYIKIVGACILYSEINGYTTTGDYRRMYVLSGAVGQSSTKPGTQLAGASNVHENGRLMDNTFDLCAVHNNATTGYYSVLNKGFHITLEKLSRFRYYTSVAGQIDVGSFVKIWRVRT